jgi:hypothetical protein
MPPKRKDLPRRPASPDAQLPPKKRRISPSDGRDVTVPERAAQRGGHLQKLKRLHLLQPESPAQHPLQMPLEGEGSSAPTPAHDQLQKKDPEDMTSKLKSLVNLMQTLPRDSAHQEELQPIRTAILQMEAPLRAGNRGQMQKAYEHVVRSIKDLVSKKTTAPPLQEACAKFLKEVEPQGKPYAWQGRTDPEAIRHLTQSFLDTARRPKLPQGQRYPRLGIYLTNAQHSKVFQRLCNLKDREDIPHSIYQKARIMAYHASDKGKAAIARYHASDKGKAVIAKYHATDKGKATTARYHASAQAKAARAIVNRKCYEKRKAASQANSNSLKEW